MTLRYDPLGRLYEVEDDNGDKRRLYYSGQDLIAEYDGSGAMLGRYVHGLSGGDDPLVAYDRVPGTVYLIAVSDLNTFTYDHENRLVEASIWSDSGSGFTQKDVTLRYDPLGRLYEVEDDNGDKRRLYYSGQDLIAGVADVHSTI